MILMIIYILICTLAIIFLALPIVQECHLFKHGHKNEGSVVSIVPFLDINKKEVRKVKISYSVENQTYLKSFKLKDEKLLLNSGDSVSILYDLKKPKNAHISVDTISLFSRFQRLILTMTAMIILSIGLRSILINLSSAKEALIISLFSLCYAALMFLIIAAIYAYIHIQTSKLKFVANGKIIDKIERKKEFTYNVEYNVNDCTFTFLYNSKEHLEIGDTIKLAYLEHFPFISRPVKL